MNADTSAVLTNTDVYTKSACFTVHDMISCFFYDEQEGYSSFHKKDKTVQIHLVSYMISP